MFVKKLWHNTSYQTNSIQIMTRIKQLPLIYSATLLNCTWKLQFSYKYTCNAVIFDLKTPSGKLYDVHISGCTRKPTYVVYSVSSRYKYSFKSNKLLQISLGLLLEYYTSKALVQSEERMINACDTGKGIKSTNLHLCSRRVLQTLPVIQTRVAHALPVPV